MARHTCSQTAQVKLVQGYCRKLTTTHLHEEPFHGVIDGLIVQMCSDISSEMVHKLTSEEESWLLEEDQHFVHEEQKPGSEVYKQHPGVAPQHSGYL